MKAVAIIPARGGSKRLPRKNVLPFRGKPMIAWTVEAAVDSGLFESVVVTTDDDEIAAAGATAGADVLRRPIEIADDRARLVDALIHWLDQADSVPDAFCMLLANCPLREAQHIREAYDILMNDCADAVLTVARYGWTPPWRAMLRGASGLEPVFPEIYSRKSQQFPESYCPSGAIYWAHTEVFQHARELYIKSLQPYVMPWHLAIDIDELDDLKLAEAIAFCLDHGLRFD